MFLMLYILGHILNQYGIFPLVTVCTIDMLSQKAVLVQLFNIKQRKDLNQTHFKVVHDSTFVCTERSISCAKPIYFRLPFAFKIMSHVQIMSNFMSNCLRKF